jgi:hypothetical protein
LRIISQLQNREKESSAKVAVKVRIIELGVKTEKKAPLVGLIGAAHPTLIQQYGKLVYGYLWSSNQEICSNSINGLNRVISEF